MCSEPTPSLSGHVFSSPRMESTIAALTQRLGKVVSRLQSIKSRQPTQTFPPQSPLLPSCPSFVAYVSPTAALGHSFHLDDPKFTKLIL